MPECAQLPNIACSQELRLDLTRLLRDKSIQLLFATQGQLKAQSDIVEVFPPVTLRAIKQRMRSFEQAQKPLGKAWLGPFRLDFSRLDGTTQWHFLLELSRGPCFLLGVEKGLSSRQREVSQLAAQGLSLREVGRHLGISENTAKTHLRKAYELVAVRSRLELARAIEDRERAERGQGTVDSTPPDEEDDSIPPKRTFITAVRPSESESHAHQ